MQRFNVTIENGFHRRRSARRRTTTLSTQTIRWRDSNIFIVLVIRNCSFVFIVLTAIRCVSNNGFFRLTLTTTTIEWKIYFIPKIGLIIIWPVITIASDVGATTTTFTAAAWWIFTRFIVWRRVIFGTLYGAFLCFVWIVFHIKWEIYQSRGF